MLSAVLQGLVNGMRAIFCHSIRLGFLQIRFPLMVCTVWFIVLYFDGNGFVRIGLLASLWHELGHILCYVWLFKRVPQLTISVEGIGLHIEQEEMSVTQKLMLAAAGPAMNLLTAAVCMFLLAHRTTVIRVAFWAANLLIGGFNLLPIPPLDGFQLICCVREFWVNKLHFRLK